MTFLFPLAAALSGAALQATPPQPAPAAQAPASVPSAQVAVGAAVSDQSGAPVGTIEKIDGANAVVSTGTNKVAVPLTAIGPGAGGLVTTVTRAQLDATAAEGPAQVKALLVVGTSIKASDGAVIGTVKSADGKLVTVTTATGDVRLPANSFAAQGDGLVIGLTAEQFAAAVAPSPGAAKKRRS